MSFWGAIAIGWLVLTAFLCIGWSMWYDSIPDIDPELTVPEEWFHDEVAVIFSGADFDGECWVPEGWTA
jgi:hypothetical protein